MKERVEGREEGSERRRERGRWGGERERLGRGRSVRVRK